MTRRLKTDAALEYLGSGNKAALSRLPHRRCEVRFGGRPPNMFDVEHLKRVRDVVDATKLPLSMAVTVVVAEIEGRLLPMNE